MKVTSGTTPPGSEWVRVPFPGCASAPCTDAPEECATERGLGDTCAQTAFPEPFPGCDCHGFGHNITAPSFHNWTIVDTVVIPEGLPSGDYLLSWRWGEWARAEAWLADYTPIQPPCPSCLLCACACHRAFPFPQIASRRPR